MIGLHDVRKFFHPAFTGKYRFKHLQNFIFYRNFLIFKADLTQIADLLVSRHRNATAFITVDICHGNIPGNQFQKSRLAAAVASDDRNFFMVMYVKVYIFNNGFRTVLYQCMSDLISHFISVNILFAVAYFPAALLIHSQTHMPVLRTLYLPSADAYSLKVQEKQMPAPQSLVFLLHFYIISIYLWLCNTGLRRAALPL